MAKTKKREPIEKKSMRIDLPADVHKHLRIEAAQRELTMSRCALQLIIEKLRIRGDYEKMLRES